MSTKLFRMRDPRFFLFIETEIESHIRLLKNQLCKQIIFRCSLNCQIEILTQFLCSMSLVLTGKIKCQCSVFSVYSLKKKKKFKIQYHQMQITRVQRFTVQCERMIELLNEIGSCYIQTIRYTIDTKQISLINCQPEN